MLSESSTGTRPYKYTRTFEAETRSKPIAEMDKEVLQAYISKLLGTTGETSSV